ncbi:DUF4124 domain-containing protein [Endozoicomonas sp. 8E]|uniref:DUF4124 domain-containing protein n=1 Tax=Endozoicomonas sp. 8E TaxID=3035692 RepID=UPI00293901B7|nr:DUF4124 domain-containing protein [Endozoicomonas sp. 8E]WOG28678.1 DUF4124 domain-containing protein [Endozoicomonas sp. 8E]
MKAIQALVLLLLTACLNLPVQAEKIFKWVDEKGTAHYSSRPPLVNVDTEIISTVNEHKEDPGDPPPSVESESAPENPSQTSQNPEVLAYCNTLSANLETLDSDDQVRLNKADGSFEILDDEGREREKERIRQQMKQFCF